jgi:small-conductance mechanosensitive channel
VDGTGGTIETVDFLSVKLRTLDGQLLRIPNEAIIKASTTNYSYYPTRRLLLRVRVAYDTDLQKALTVLASVPGQVPKVLSDPAPNTYVETFGDSDITLCLTLWLDCNDRWAVQNAASVAVQQSFASAGIAISLPQVHVHQEEK